MCAGNNDAPEPVEVERPVFVRNPYLDEQPTGGRGSTNRVDRSALYIPFETGIGFEGRGGSGAGTDGGQPMGNSSLTRGGVRTSSLPIVPRPGPAPGVAPRTPGPGPRLNPRDFINPSVFI